MCRVLLDTSGEITNWMKGVHCQYQISRSLLHHNKNKNFGNSDNAPQMIVQSEPASECCLQLTS